MLYQRNEISIRNCVRSKFRNWICRNSVHCQNSLRDPILFDVETLATRNTPIRLNTLHSKQLAFIQIQWLKMLNAQPILLMSDSIYLLSPNAVST